MDTPAMAGLDGYVISMFESANEFVKRIDGAGLLKNCLQLKNELNDR